MAPKTRPSRGSAIANRLRAKFVKTYDAGMIPQFDPSQLHPLCLPTGLDSLDVGIGAGGYPEGRITILHGGESVGKTTAGILALANAQAAGGFGIVVDGERKFHKGWAQRQGCNVGDLIMVEPPHIEAGFDVVLEAIAMARDDAPDAPIVVLWDSLQGNLAMQTDKKDFAEKDFPRESQSYSRGFAKIVPKLSAARIVFLAISQIRMKMDGFGGSTEKVGVGKAPLFYASLIIKLKSDKMRAKLLTHAPSGAEAVKAIMIKNQIATPWRVAEFDNLYGIGLDRPGAAFYAAVAVGITERVKGKAGEADGGGWYDVRMGTKVIRVQGPGGMRALADADPKIYQGIRDEVRTHLGEEVGPIVAADDRAAALAEIEDELGKAPDDQTVPADAPAAK